MIHFANTSEGRVEIVAPYYALRVGAYRIPFVIDLDARTLNIIRIYRVTF
ncbi:MAG TPA: hypothetical protein PK156_11670 [Polyangium sp.]|nr:hypothetical protein [Polyangium sp.]